MERNPQRTIDHEYSPHSSSTWLDRDAKFLAMLPRIRRQAAYHLRHLSTEERAEGVQEVVAGAYVSYVRLTERGKSDLAYAGPLARYGASQYLSGRRVGSRMNAHDLTSELCRKKNGVKVERLDRFDERIGDWQELVVEDRNCTPADVAATRLDFRAWLAQLSLRTRRIAKDLARGYSTSEVACKHCLSTSRISQLRHELFDGWLPFTGESPR
jgi:hypothetical protein